jgi:hypothetical protein
MSNITTEIRKNVYLTNNLLQHHYKNINDPTKICEKLMISDYSFHRLNLLIHGLNIENKSDATTKNNIDIYNEFHLRIVECSEKKQNIIPLKLPLYPHSLTPYRYIDGRLYFLAEEILSNYLVYEVPLPEKNIPRYLKGYSFPHIGSENPFYALRINPKNTGFCPGKCIFCHRSYSHRLVPAFSSIIQPDSLVESIIKKYGSDIFEKVKYITIVTELFGNENMFLDYLEKLKRHLIKNGYNSNGEFACCAQDVRTEKGLKRLYDILTPKRYQYTLEVFSNRDKIMGKYKGIHLEVVSEILKRARKVGFQEIQINYLAGIDSMEEFKIGIEKLHYINHIDLIGMNVLTVFSPEQFFLRNQEGWTVEYYYEIVKYIKKLNIKFYKPESFEMGPPLEFILD